MSNGSPWSSGYRPSRLRGPGRDYHSCPNGRAKCWVCSRPDLVAYRADRLPSLSDSLDDLVDYVDDGQSSN